MKNLIKILILISVLNFSCNEESVEDLDQFIEQQLIDTSNVDTTSFNSDTSINIISLNNYMVYQGDTIEIDSSWVENTGTLVSQGTYLWKIYFWNSVENVSIELFINNEQNDRILSKKYPFSDSMLNPFATLGRNTSFFDGSNISTLDSGYVNIKDNGLSNYEVDFEVYLNSNNEKVVSNYNDIIPDRF